MNKQYLKGPGWRELPGLLKLRFQSALPFYERLCTDYGPLAFLKIGSLRFCFINDAEAVKTVTQDHANNYTKGSGYGRLRPIAGNGLLTAEGDEWRKNRRLAQPAFHRDQMLGHIPMIQKVGREWVQKNSERRLNLGEECSRLTLQLATRMLFGADSVALADEVVGHSQKILAIWGEKAVDWLRLVDVLLPFGRDTNLSFRLRRKLGSLKEFDRHLAALDAIVYRLIDQKSEGNDVLSLMITTQKQDPDAMSRQQLRDEVMTLLIAGYETTASTLLWTLIEWNRHPELRPEVLDDLKAGSSFMDSALMRFIQETLRLHPPIWRYSREAISDDEVLGTPIEKGTVMVVCPYFLHRNPRYWPDPEKFDPSRFTAAASAARPRMSYVPFGSGPRTCIGMDMAYMNLHTLLAEILPALDLKFESEEYPEPQADLTLKPSKPVMAQAIPL